jgi:hypothetical protein
VSFVPMPLYTLSVNITNPSTVTNLQIRANATRPIVIVGVKVIPRFTLTANTWVPATIGRIPTTFATVTALAAGDTDPHHPSFAASGIQFGTTHTGHTATGAATYTDTWEVGYNTQGGLNLLFLPEDRKLIAAATGFGIIHVVAPPAGSYSFQFIYGEI